MVSSNQVVKPTNNALHLQYSFYVQLTAKGGSIGYHGPYTLEVGCTATSFTHVDQNPFNNNGVAKYVGDSTASVYTFVNPTTSLAWCQSIQNVVLKSDGVTASDKLNNCASQVCQVFSLVDTINPETVTFKIKTTFTGSLVTHLSPLITTVITCSAAYTITEVAAPTNP